MEVILAGKVIEVLVVYFPAIFYYKQSLTIINHYWPLFSHY